MGLFDRLRNGGPRVAFIGIDGVPFQLITSHPSTFPNLNDIADRGSADSIDSIVPPESSACWPSLTSGVNPGETGVYGFQDREAGSYETYVPMGRDIQSDRVWDNVHRAGRKATVMNVPVTFPPQRNVQRMVSGFLSPELSRAAYPDELLSTLESLDYRIDVNAKLGHKSDKTDFIANARETLEGRYEAFKHYIQLNDWDLFFGVFMTTDRVNHFLYQNYEEGNEYVDEFLEFYATLDRYIGHLDEELDDDVTIIIASDHGFTTLESEVHMNRWLMEKGWLKYTKSDHQDLSDIADETRAYSLIPGRFYLNLAGREPRGSVSESDYEGVRDELKAILLDFEAPDGRKVCDRVVEKEEAFRGNHDMIAPDLVALPNDGFDLKAGFKSNGGIFDKGPRNGMHTFSDASLIIDDDTAVVSEANLYDIAPTILGIMEIDFDKNTFDGASLI